MHQLKINGEDNITKLDNSSNLGQDVEFTDSPDNELNIKNGQNISTKYISDNLDNIMLLLKQYL